MRMGKLSILLAASAAIAGVAHGQDAPSAPANEGAYHAPSSYQPSEPGWSGDPKDMTAGMTSGPAIEVGFSALEAGNFARAEEVFAKAVRRDPRDAAANFYLGATRMDLGKWEDAKKHLEIAASKIRRHPDPKSRLGVTYAKLGNIAGAQTQRAALVKMTESCKDTCRLAPFIRNGIQMIDEALAAPRAQG